MGGNQLSPRPVPCLQTPVWAGRLPQDGARGPEGGARGKGPFQISDRIAPSSSAAMELTLRIEAPREAALAPSGATALGDVRRRRGIGDDQVLAEEGVGVSVVAEAVVVEAGAVVEEVGAGAVVAAVVVEDGAREEVVTDHENPRTQILSFGIERNADAIECWKARHKGR